MQNSARNGSGKWRWILGFIVAVLLVWAVARLIRDDGEALSGRAVGIPVVAPEPVVQVDPLGPGDLVRGAGTGAGEAIPVAAIVATPEAFQGQRVAGTAVVGVSIADHGFWIEEAGRRLLVVVAQSGGEAPQGDDSPAAPSDTATPANVRPGQRVELSGRVYPGAMALQVATELDADTRRILSAQPAFLLVDPADIGPAEVNPADVDPAQIDAEGASRSPPNSTGGRPLSVS